MLLSYQFTIDFYPDVCDEAVQKAQQGVKAGVDVAEEARFLVLW
jgi:hypothetical protein